MPNSRLTGGRSRPVIGIALVAGALALACTREAHVNSGLAHVGQAGPDTVSGLVRQVGNSPFMQTIVVGDDTVTVTGRYAGQITRLVGAQVRLTGRIDPGSGMGKEMDATSYEILDVDGVRPLVGILEQVESGFALRASDGQETRLLGVSERLASLAGGRVWVVLTDAGVVTRYGILSEPDET